MKYIGLVSSDARGKNGGNVASRNRFGTYLRRHVAPVQTRSTAQIANRQTFGAISGSWRGLTAAVQQGWNTLATTVTFKDSLGSSYNPTGAQLYMLCSRNLNAASVGFASAAPTAIPEIPAITTWGADFFYGSSTASVTLSAGGTGYTATGTFSVQYATGTNASGTYVATAGVITALTLTAHGQGQTGEGTFSFTGGGTGAVASSVLSGVIQPALQVVFAPTPVPASVALFIYASKSISVGTTFSSKSQSRLCMVVPTGGTSAASVGASYLSVFGQPPTHGQVRVRGHYVDLATGFPGPDQVADVTY